MQTRPRSFASLLLLACAVLHPAPALAHPLEPIQVLAEGEGGTDALWGARAFATSPDGLHAYVLGTKSRSLAAVDLADLDWVDVEREGEGGVAGLDDAWDVIVSPDGAHVYVASGLENLVATFARDGATGALAFAGSVGTGLSPNNSGSIFRGASLAISPDGAHVYVTSQSDKAVARFARDAGSGALTFLDETELPGFEIPASIATSPDGEHVYVGRYPWGAGEYVPRIEVLERDPANGALALASAYTDPIHDFGTCCDYQTNRIHEIAFSPDGAHVYAAVDSSTDLSGLGPVRRYGALAVFARDAGTGALSHVETQQSAPPGYDSTTPHLRGARGVAVSPDGAHVYVASAVSDAVVAFARDGATGALTPLGSLVDRLDGVRGLEGPVGVAVSPHGARVFAASADDDALVAFDRDTGAGTLAFADVLEDGGVRGVRGGLSVGASPDGRFVYVSGDAFSGYPSQPVVETDAPPSSIGIFARDPGTGLLAPAGEYEQLPAAASLLVPTTLHLYALVGNDVLCFARDPQTGALAPIQTLVDAAQDLLATHDGQHLYVAPPGAGASDRQTPIVHYRRPAPEQDLEPVATYDDLGNGAVVYGPGFALGPGQRRIHALGEIAGVWSILTFATAADGSLLYRFADPVDETDLGARSLAATTRTYAAFDHGFLMHDRRIDGGGLLWSTDRTFLWDDPEQWPRFQGVDALQDGSRVYFAYGYYSAYLGYDLPGVISVWEEVDGSGELDFVETEFAADLRDENSFALAPDGRHLYAASGYEDTMVVFSTPEPGAGSAVLAAYVALAMVRRRARR